jgi:hypothetical protein
MSNRAIPPEVQVIIRRNSSYGYIATLPDFPGIEMEGVNVDTLVDEVREAVIEAFGLHLVADTLPIIRVTMKY